MLCRPLHDLVTDFERHCLAWYLRHACLVLASLSHAVMANMAMANEAMRAPTTSHVNQADRVKAFFAAYCVSCHGERIQEQQIRLDTLDYSLGNAAAASAWQEVLDELNLGRMPPPDEKQPSPEEYTAVLASLTDSLKSARERLASSGGSIAMRHLNKREYAATVQDLFGMRIPTAQIPEDVNHEPFDTIGSGQYFTPFELERYFVLGKQFVTEALKCIPLGRQQKPLANRQEPEEFLLGKARKDLDEMRRQMALVKQGADWKVAGFEGEKVYKDFLFNYEAQEKRNMAIAENPAPESKTGVYFASPIGYRLYVVSMAYPGATYTLRVRGGIKGDLPGERTLLKLTGEDETFGTLSFNGSVDEPEVVEIEFETMLDGDNKTGFEVHGNTIRNGKQWRKYFDELGDDGLHSPVWLDWLEITGPHHREPAFFETCLRPILEKPEPTDDEVKEVLARFAYECFRHSQPKSEYLDGLFALYTMNRKSGLPAKDAIADPLAVILSSPAFLYIQEASGEQEPSGGRRQVLDQKEFAIRLAYFLWSAAPDDELYELAERGVLYEPDVLNRTVDRMLASPKARRFIRGFVEQWADLKKFDAIKTHEDFYQFMDVTRFSARQEPAEFFHVLVSEDLPIANLIDSDFAVIDKTLSVFYGIPGRFDHRFQKVSLPPVSPRGGLLGQAAFLVMTSTGDRTSPVARGAFVMKKFLDHEPAPPPPNVPALEIPADGPKSMRELTLMHETKPQCASCHSRIDPLGFGLENFDPSGLWREQENIGKKSQPIDASGALPDGSSFDDFEGLKTLLANHEDALARGVYKSLFSYAIGRRIDFSDEAEVASALESLKERHYPVKSMILSIVGSKTFRSK